MRGQGSTWLGLENGAGQGTLLDLPPYPPCCCPRSRKEWQTFPSSPVSTQAGLEAWGSVEVEETTDREILAEAPYGGLGGPGAW